MKKSTDTEAGNPGEGTGSRPGPDPASGSAALPGGMTMQEYFAWLACNRPKEYAKIMTAALA